MIDDRSNLGSGNFVMKSEKILDRMFRPEKAGKLKKRMQKRNTGKDLL